MASESGLGTARALWISGRRTLELRPEPLSHPRTGEVLVRALASGISQGSELLVYRGDVPPDLPLDLPTLDGAFTFPVKYGYALVGCVEEVGNSVTSLVPGDKVFVHHPHQEAFIVPATMPVPLPVGLDPVLGIFTANVETAVNALLDTPLHLGEAVAVFGLGVVGLLIAQLLKLAGAGLVVGVDPLPGRRAVGRAVGIDAVLPADGDAAQRIRDLTLGRGADIAIEASGHGEALQIAVEAVADEATIVAVSWYGQKPVTLMLGGHFHRGRVKIQSSQVGRLNPAVAPRWDRDRRMAFVQRLLPSMHLAELITHRVSLARAAEAYELLEKQPDATLQVVLTYTDED
jgi:2-desacetyl-2-hydroxyethyl bacteriochlorophyllide A dehydrogenase